ncbi:hypothetical protein H7U37_01980 [Pseudoflavonifractor phocaeensis]|uniref:hypothetical protein n=1 Tax=Pseudoflavonifractor phocaeensis TaxID=1870988 RepID=UPI001959CC93|nr:hypothetical protein [Pseudoflavonifractor phocaeensis]MBM6937296.1 hypothetical protein [Pseudoflavonifractor phocaeensis]
MMNFFVIEFIKNHTISQTAPQGGLEKSRIYLRGVPFRPGNPSLKILFLLFIASKTGILYIKTEKTPSLSRKIRTVPPPLPTPAPIPAPNAVPLPRFPQY